MNKFKLLLLIWTHLTLRVYSQKRELLDSCDDLWPKCGKKQNIVCELGGNCKPSSKSCVPLVMDDNDRNYVLKEHNRLRNLIASGKETRGGASTAGNMMVLSYNMDLEYTATCNVNRCVFGHDKCRATKRFPHAGQNLFMSKGKNSERATKGASQDWYDEIKDMEADIYPSFRTPADHTKVIGHFTQLIWATTTHLGCAKASMPSKKTVFYACNYGPAGNINKKAVYISDAPCTHCPTGLSCNKQYTSLCGEIEPFDSSDVSDESNGSSMKLGSCDETWPPCGKKENIVCQMGGGCSTPPFKTCRALKMTNKFRNYILNEHNTLRNLIASGNETRNGASSAGNMMVLSYDMDLEYTAACNVNRCTFGHDPCHATKRFPAVGQNLFLATGKNSQRALKSSPKAWYSEINEMDAARFKSFRPPKNPAKAIGHFTQVVWATTTHVGCAKALCSSKKNSFFACNYAPSGNVMKKPVYIEDEPCTKCPKGLGCNKKYPSLCGQIEPFNSRISNGSLKLETFIDWKYLNLGIYLIIIIYYY